MLSLLEEALNVLKGEPTAEHLTQARERLEELLQYEKHYLRKENVLFPYLEKHGFGGPTTVMWGIHDEIRQGWRKLEALLSEGPQTDPEAFGTQSVHPRPLLRRARQGGRLPRHTGSRAGCDPHPRVGGRATSA